MQSGPEPAAKKKQRVVARHHPDQRDEQGPRVGRGPAINHEAAGQQREILRHRQSEATQDQHQEQPGVAEMLNVSRNQPVQDLTPVGVALRRLANLLDRHAVVGQLARGHRFADTDFAARAVRAAKAIQQALVTVVLLASAVAVQLREQLRMLLRDRISLPGIALKLVRIERQAVADQRRTCAA